MRTLGAAVLGLFSGLLAGVLLGEVVARAALGGGKQVLPLPLALLAGFAPLVLAGVGAIVAVVLKRHHRAALDVSGDPDRQ